jgi:hypothetical protein
MQYAVKITIIITFLFILGCKKNDPEPAAPIITFLNASLSQDKTFINVQFEFFDADGDLGLKQNENQGSQEFNLFVEYYEMTNGIWIKKSPVVTWNTSENKFDTTELHLRMPFLENETNGELKGETSVDLFYDFNADTLKYELLLKDRSLQSSNIIETSEIIVN